MRISDWSSDVCSSDLIYLKVCAPPETVRVLVPRRWRLDPPGTFMRRDDIQPDATPLPDGYRLEQDTTDSIDTMRVLAADDSVGANGQVDRKSVVWGKSVEGRVDLGGVRIIKKKNKSTHKHTINTTTKKK